MESSHIKLFRIVTALAIVTALLSYPRAFADTDDLFANKPHTPSNERFDIGPGRVSLQLTPDGFLRSFTPQWSNGRSAITGGGFVFMAQGQGGGLVELANTCAGGLQARLAASGVAVHEGIPGGARWPMADRDDDADGRENEDRLDGADNDGDGKIDEDYAAIGDRMVVLGYDARTDDRRPLLSIHQECYAWTLPHIDAMVAMKLAVRNTGTEPLRGFRVGFLAGRNDDFSLSTQDLEPSPGDHGRELVSKGMLLTGSGGPALAVLLFAESAAGDAAASWLTGVARGNRRLVDLVRTALAAEGESASETSAVEKAPSTQPLLGDSRAYGVSPSLGVLAPGAEAVFYVALVAVETVERADREIEDAYRTVTGNGDQRMVPPPVSMTRRNVWGTYRDPEPGEAGRGTIIELETGGLGIGPDDISYLTGVDLGDARVRTTFDGKLEIELGESGAIEGSGRVVLRGRLRGGDVIDVILRPGESATTTVGDSDHYWTRPGQLDEAYLSGSPNPFRESTTIFYEIPSKVSGDDGSFSFFNPIQTSVKVYNVAGRLVDTLVDTILPPGMYNVQWDAVDEGGHNVASGVYYVKLQVGKKHVTKRLIQLK